jgi:hypothetical protein
MATEVTIKGLVYHVEPIPPGEDGTTAYRVLGPRGQVYDLLRTHDGTIECTCPHYEARLKGNSRSCCKHGKAAVEAGLLPAPGVDPLAVIPPTGVCVGCSRSVFKADLKGGDCPACRAERQVETAACEGCKGTFSTFDLRECLCPACRAEVEDFDPASASEEDAPPEPPEPWADFEPLEPADDEVPFADDNWSEFDIWTLGPPPPLVSEPSPAEAPPGLTLLDWVTHQIRHYELMGTSLGWMVAGTLRKLAAEVRATGAANPAQLEERLEVLAAGHEDDLGRLRRAEDVLSRIEAAINAREHR